MKDFIKRVNEYYPVYLLAHQNPWNKLIHMVGNLCLLATTVLAVYCAFHWYPPIGAIFALALYLPFHLTYFIYIFAWTGHLLIEKNEPATWKVSRWITKACDWKMMFQLVTRKLKWDTRARIRPEMIKMATTIKPKLSYAHPEKIGEYEEHSGTKGVVSWHERNDK